MDIDTKAVIQFAHVARTRSFSRSAQELGVSQPWLSGRIRRLEARLGTMLFARTTRRVELTAEGEALLPQAQALASAALAFDQAAAELRGHGGRIRIGTPPYGLAVEERFALIDRFAATTGAVVEMEIGWSTLLVERLLAQALDAAFLVEPFDTRALETVRIRTMELVIQLRADDPATAHALLAPHDLAGTRLGVFARALNPDLFDRLYPPLREAGVMLVELPELRRSLLTDGAHGDLRALSLIRPAPTWPIADSGGLATRPIAGVPTVDFHVARRKGSTSRAAARFWAMVLAQTAGATG